MSVWDRMRGLFGGTKAPATDPTSEAPSPSATSSTGPAPTGPAPIGPGTAEHGPLVTLAALASRPSSPIDEAEAIRALDAATERGEELSAIDVCRRLLLVAPLPELRLRVAERLLSRGDDVDAETLVSPLVSASEPAGSLPRWTLPAWMLAAELAERRGDRVRARALYERIVARDLSFPRAKERAARLKETADQPRRDAGATLVAEGASTRRFRLREELGRGGAGTVFLAEEPGLDRLVALKVYHRRGRSDRERLLVEARSAAAFSHASIVRILDVDETLGAIAMEPLLSGSVKQAKERGASPDALRALMLSITEALVHVHERGVVHCDLKPSNFLVREPGHAVLTDFGLARAVGAPPRDEGEGTLSYMSPEQRGAAVAHPAMDVFALGVSLRELFGLDHLTLGPSILSMCSSDPRARPPLHRVVALLERPLP